MVGVSVSHVSSASYRGLEGGASQVRGWVVRVRVRVRIRVTVRARVRDRARARARARARVRVTEHVPGCRPVRWWEDWWGVWWGRPPWGEG